MSISNTNDELTKNVISYLRFPLSVGIVFIHYNLAKNPFSIHGVEYGTDCSEWFIIFATFLSNVVSRIGVPLFYFISGFLFFYGKEFCYTVYIRKLRSRISTLLIPYFLWNTLAILLTLMYMLPLFASIMPNVQQTEIHLSLVRILKTYFANFENEGIFVSPVTSSIPEKYPWPINVPLWYVRDLMLLVILSPLFYKAIRFAGKWLIFALGLLYFFFEPLVMPEGGWTVSIIRSSFFFAWGAYFSINRQDFINSMSKFKYAPALYLPLAIADTLTKTAEYNIFIEQAGIVVGIVSAIIIVSYLLRTNKVKVNDTLSKSSFFIYCLHTLIISEIGKIVFLIFNLQDNTLSILFLYLFVPTITIIICICTYNILKKYVPFLHKLLTGNR